MKAVPNVALVGCGGWGKNLARNLAELGALRLIVDPSPAAAEIAERLGVAIAGDIAVALNDPAIEGVVVATPAESHAELALAAYAVGKHVYLEKPIALSMEDAEACASAAEAAGRVLMVGHLLQYHCGYHALQSVAASDLGRILHIDSERSNLGIIRNEENVMWSFSPHDISMVLGLAPAKPVRVCAVGSAFWQDGIADVVTLTVEFADGVKAEIRSSWASTTKTQRIRVTGERAIAVFDDMVGWSHKLEIIDYSIDRSQARPKVTRGASRLVELEVGEPLKAEMQHFLDCMRTGARPRTDAAEAMAVLAVLQAGEASLEQEGVWIHV